MSDSNNTPVVKLQLSVPDFRDDPWLHYIADCERRGIIFFSLAELGETEANQRHMYELNKECSADLPGRGPFYSYEECCAQRLEVDSFVAFGVIFAVDGGVPGDPWVCMAGVSHRLGQDYTFNEMTGVVRTYRRRGIATALKLRTIQVAESLGVQFIYTSHAAANVTAIAMNRRLGYTYRP